MPPTAPDALITVDDRSTDTAVPARIRDEVYGHFLESAFFGNIEGGVLDEGSPLSVTAPGPLQGCRRDVIDACRELGLPVVRWPGGNFTSAYWWTDGTGPRDERPRRLELAWGSEESNRFGTPEFLAWCAAVGTRPYLAHSARSVEDAVRWVEYTNYAGDTEMTRRRTADGITEPAGVRWWGLGNEVYGPWQMGHRPVEQYVADAREHARFMNLVDPGLSFVAVGDQDPRWNRAVVQGLGDVVDHVSLHLYGGAEHLTTPTREEFEAVVAQPVWFEAAVQDCASQLRRFQREAGHERPLAIALDEWNIRHHEPADWPEPQPGEDGGIAPRDPAGTGAGTAVSAEGAVRRHRVNRYSPRTLADALFYSGVFHAMHRAASLPVPVGMANTVNLVNANGLLAVRPGGLVRTPTYHVWDLYQNHTGRVALPTRLEAPARQQQVRQGAEHAEGGYLHRPATVSLLDVSATTDEDHGTLYLSVVNRSADRDLTAELHLTGRRLPATAVVRDLGAGESDLFAHNTLQDPERIALSAPREVSLTGGCTFPAHSVTVLEVAL
ncbi:alpha-L-arabinofuranosidase C-terminal domain-containing protein [Auraticoccus monumenti]|uniref:non-reducing end alpha-L-arabinofuranosidase n=1 Tax=Auraticoccus monumenti TaxID=675864 RepID=A0A1G6ZCZ9_9ACTN|nr:alpha-L-arabinofuranosidase C-terminal domain-containing protein [Auraticoccus monumenti]SDD99626.1 alpha-N-arabinofuranosidase [Auraticoccus monumenti]